MKISRLLTVILAFLVCCTSSHLMAEEKVNLSDESTTKEILLDKDWICGLGDGSGWGGQTAWKFEEVKGKKIAGKVSLEYCGGVSTNQSTSVTEASLTGKIKKDTMKFTVIVNQGNCVNFSGKIKFIKEDATSYRADGRYTRNYNGKSYRGTLFCYVR